MGLQEKKKTNGCVLLAQWTFAFSLGLYKTLCSHSREKENGGLSPFPLYKQEESGRVNEREKDGETEMKKHKRGSGPDK